ncbi:DEAD/DEAH box helicase family protein [Leptolyngbya sp. FACHB-321]|uniref:EcoAI/FtnUII family type I restriction enzme subunit R n=1 Tax=Leptolyngbya sp. FACHB-321 TaxID=2692807 RepID=UPI001683DEAC|nr:DEAD/DEAH box helicase family protein [Leptolyngbya sp. FACHB-321]MBD2033633.1 DEAD/DEAH box helicase family protein [Leptolyngbya sp. FACHB-321]
MSEEIDRRSLSERDICTKYLTPGIVGAGWNVQTQMREEVTFTKGRVNPKGKLISRGESKRADYILYYKPNIPLAVVEAKDNNHGIGDGMQQALTYAEIMGIPFVYSSNGDAFLEHDRTGNAAQTERELALNEFPSPEQLWQRYCAWKGIEPGIEPIVAQEYYFDGSGKEPRYYQLNAINRTIEAIAKGQNRILLVMATGTGKTFTAFQIIWRLWRSGAKKRILFLADRNILIDQTKTNDFKPFGSAMTKITKRQADKSFEIYLSLYQAVSGTTEAQDIYKQFSRNFFDLVIIDECHRGSAAEDSAWREILEYFESATQIGLTATPRETKEISNIEYFGESLYTYSLKQGIEDGFLAPYKVVRIDIDKDLEGWRPQPGEKDKYGREIEDRIYNQKDINRTIVFEPRDELVAQRITQFLQESGDPYMKTIVFCEDVDHAERMRKALVNENAALVAQNRKYIMRITGDENEGKAELDNFIAPYETHPVIVTTSRLMTTGIDAQTCKLIVLDRRIESPTEFKQIIGRGTRINEEYHKLYFTIMDFKQATERFYDPEFDGDPVQIYEPKTGEPIVPPVEEGGEDVVIIGPTTGSNRRIKYVVATEGAEIVRERVQYYSPDGRLITESIKDFTRKTMRQEFASLDAFLKRWSEAAQKQEILRALERQGILLEALAEEVGKDFDSFDLICHVAFDQPPLSRRERAEEVRKRDYFTKYGEQVRDVLDALLNKYADEGIENIENINVLKVQPMNRYGTPMEIIKLFGSRQAYFQAVQEMTTELYRVA